MSASPVICFGQQPCGFFPRRFFFAKVQTARRLQAEIGGEIVLFYHDSDHDPRETRTILRHRKNGEPLALNFVYANRWQRKFSPLYLKRVLPDWHARTAEQIAPFVAPRWVEAFKQAPTTDVASFCLDLYRSQGLLDDVRVVRSSNSEFRTQAVEVDDFYVDVPYEGEIVRARLRHDQLFLHEGGDAYITLPLTPFGKEQISPARDTRLRWMQSVVRCTHYVAGASEQAYLRREDAPEVTYVPRDPIDRADEAYVAD
jgi:hypothetical protein